MALGTQGGGRALRRADEDAGLPGRDRKLQKRTGVAGREPWRQDRLRLLGADEEHDDGLAAPGQGELHVEGLGCGRPRLEWIVAAGILVVSQTAGGCHQNEHGHHATHGFPTVQPRYRPFRCLEASHPRDKERPGPRGRGFFRPPVVNSAAVPR
jgi:hypothetical protein